MANTTTYLTQPAASRLGTQIVYIEKEVDFSDETVATAGTADVLRLPKGAVLKRVGWITKATESSVTFILEGSSLTLTGMSSAEGIGSNNAVVNVDVDNSVVVSTTDEALRVTVGGADATAAVVVFFAEYAVSDACRN